MYEQVFTEYGNDEGFVNYYMKINDFLNKEKEVYEQHVHNQKSHVKANDYLSYKDAIIVEYENLFAS